MYKDKKGNYLYSPSDLTTFINCKHAIYLEIKSLNNEIENIQKISNAELLLQKKGLEHEYECLKFIKNKYKKVVEIPKNKNLQERVNITRNAIQKGADAIYQASFIDNNWQGNADFLIKCNNYNAKYFYYEVIDSKLSKVAKPEHIMQLCSYTDFLSKIQKFLPKKIHLFLGNTTIQTLKTSDFFYYYKFIKNSFENYLNSSANKNSYPESCAHCKCCKWQENCKNQWVKDNHLNIIANIQKQHIEKLNTNNILTLKELASSNSDLKIQGLNKDLFLRLRSQAILQDYKSTTGKNKYKILELSENKGFYRIPKPSDGDLFFDMEGDPFHQIEYLFGIYYTEKNKKIFKSFWAHDHKEEKETFETFMHFIANHIRQYPDAYIYHYNHYETSALKRLSSNYATCEEKLNNLLRKKKFVDLYCVVREGIMVSENGYSIKNLEKFYMDTRNNEVTTAIDSIVVYNEWRETKNNKLLNDIENYNKLDCISTNLLRDWLISIKPKNIPWFDCKSSNIESKKEEIKPWEIEYEDYKKRLNQNLNNLFCINERIINLLEFHKRESNAQYWSLLDKQTKHEDEIIDEIECIGGMEQLHDPYKEKKSLIYTYKFPKQEHKIKVKSKIINALTGEFVGTAKSLDNDSLTIEIKRGENKEQLPKKISIALSTSVTSNTIRAAIYKYTENFLNGKKNQDVATKLLAKHKPKIKKNKTKQVNFTSDNELNALLSTIENLDNSYFFIQGPPGTGKTHTASIAIIYLLSIGKKIGVTSNSHKAVHNLLNKIENIAKEKNISFFGIKKAIKNNEETFFYGNFIKNETIDNDINLSADLFAGTAWTFVNQNFEDHLDYLFIDEASQVATANVIAMSNSTKNIILIGDQMQLSQPIQGTHPDEAGLSILEFLFGNKSIADKESGIFLKKTYRMKSEICKFISEAFYDCQLTSHESTNEKRLKTNDHNLPNEGVAILKIKHNNCSQKSIEESIALNKIYTSLIKNSFIEQGEKFNEQKKITENDIIVITPYNAQVNYLQSILPKNAKIGTVDKFQGQEAPIALISMVSSDMEYISKNKEFIYKKNRLNVAISRAKYLSIIIASTNLLEAKCNNINQIKLINTFCWLNNYAKKINFDEIR